MANDQKQTGRALDTTLNAKGQETATARLASPGGVDEMYISPNQAIPVVFVPGIMGSPLIAAKSDHPLRDFGKWAWFPDDPSWVVTGYGNLGAAQRRQLLDPAATRVIRTPADASDEILSDYLEGKSMPVEEAKRRGWGSVMITSYGGILDFLENQLRFIFYRGHVYPGTEAARPRDASQWGEVNGYQRLSDDQLRKAAAWRYPVYAVGYNWMDSNAKAADYLKLRIDEIRADCRERLKLKCDQVILVTHSMGGLVARLCAKRYASDILGVVHGVQPALGAGTAYARVRAGWESNASLLRPLDLVPAVIGAWALGPTGEEVTAVFANGPGPLELLPNQFYGSDWLRVEYEDRGIGGAKRSVFSLPKSDPYEEIYRVSDKWWRLVHPGLLVNSREHLTDPVKVQESWDQYTGKLDQAKDFHTELGNYYHPVTYAHCGIDSGRKGWYRVTWKLTPMQDAATGIWSRQPSAEAARDLCRITSDRMKGNCTIHNAASAGEALYNRNGEGVTGYYAGDTYRAWLSDHDDAGDATVPGHSGRAPQAAAQFFATMRGFEHQKSYDDEAVRAVTLYSVLRIGAQAKPIA